MEVRILPGAFGHLVRISGKLPLPQLHRVFPGFALVAESADAPDSKSGGGNTVSVQVRSGAVSYLRQVVKTQPFHGWIVGSNPAGTTDWQISNTRPWNLSVIRFIFGRTALQGRFFFFVQSARAVCPILFEFCPITSMNPYKMRLLLSN